MAETIASHVLEVLRGFVSEWSVSVNAARKGNLRHEIDNLPIKLNGIRIKQLVKEAKDVLDKGKGPDLKRFTNLATILTEGELYGDIIKRILYHKFEENIIWDNFETKLDNLEKRLRSVLDKHLESQSSGRENEGDPPGNVRRALLYLSRFPTNYVFNRQRISRLLVAHEFIAADKLLLQQLTNWLEPAEEKWDGVGAPNHFLIGNNVKNSIPMWPESHNLVREVVAESIGSIDYEIFHSSLIFLGESNYTLELKERQFCFLKVLSLRNRALKNEEYLKTLSLLKYLDLKNTTVEDCSWLEGLEELQMLDLRYTKVEEIPDNCLEKLGKLQNLLLGYYPKEGVSRLAGVKLNTKKLKSENLETLRAIRLDHVDVIEGCVDKVVDLSVTDLDTERLKNFWDAVGKFQKLTSLGVSVTKNTVITLEDCPEYLKNQLNRLRMECQNTVITLPQDCRYKFRNLIDLTLASDNKIIDEIPTLESLLCLRLYGYNSQTLTLRLEGFNGLKKVVIGDMKEVTKIEISSAVIDSVTTLKLCNLKKFGKLVCLDTQRPLLRCKVESIPDGSDGFKDIKSKKTIFLRGFDHKKYQASPNLEIYHYYMNKQCYIEQLIKPHDSQS